MSKRTPSIDDFLLPDELKKAVMQLASSHPLSIATKASTLKGGFTMDELINGYRVMTAQNLTTQNLMSPLLYDPPKKKFILSSPPKLNAQNTSGKLNVKEVLAEFKAEDVRRPTATMMANMARTAPGVFAHPVTSWLKGRFQVLPVIKTDIEWYAAPNLVGRVDVRYKTTVEDMAFIKFPQAVTHDGTPLVGLLLPWIGVEFL